MAAATTTTLASSVNPSEHLQNVTLTATVSPSAATGTVTFKDGATAIGTGPVTGGVATLLTSFNVVGSHALTAVYGGDSNHTGSTGSLTQMVKTATPKITWVNPADIVFGTALSGTQLNATADVPGAFVYSPPAGTALNAGNNQTLSVTFTPMDTDHDTTVMTSVLINVLKATPAIVWANPADIVFGTALGAAQLNATANVPGAFVYTPPGGTVLNAGAGQPLSASFTPTDGANYNPTTASVVITVNRAPASVTPNPASKVVGQPDPVFTGTLSGFLPSDGVTATYVRTPGETVGTYTISAALNPVSVLGNYTITFNTAVFTIQPPPNRAPVCSAAGPTVSEIWPPNHKKVSPVGIRGVSDPDGDSVAIKVTAIWQDEPTKTNGDGNTWIDGFGVGSSIAEVRAERTGTLQIPGNGRIYEIFFTGTDTKGASCTGSVKVGVPHDQGKGPSSRSTVSALR